MQTQVHAAKTCHRLIERAEGFERLQDSAVDAIIHQRPYPDDVQRWLSSLSAEALPEGRYLLNLADAGRCLADAFAANGVEMNAAMKWVCDDVAMLAQRVMDVSPAPLLRLRLDPVFDNACSKFHIDNVHARLICTYRGLGTEVCFSDNGVKIIRPIETGDAILLKGKLWPQSNDVQLKHRSPQIEGTGQVRWLVVLEGASLEDDLSRYDQSYPSHI